MSTICFLEVSNDYFKLCLSTKTYTIAYMDGVVATIRRFLGYFTTGCRGQPHTLAPFIGSDSQVCKANIIRHMHGQSNNAPRLEPQAMFGKIHNSKMK